MPNVVIKRHDATNVVEVLSNEDVSRLPMKHLLELVNEGGTYDDNGMHSYIIYRPFNRDFD